MIPQVGVDYSKCQWPIQLSSEIDRWGWSVAQPHYTGGVVSMSPQHWHAVNGFPNNFFGWGGEDDDLMQRLNQNNLGKGVTTHLGKALMRPAKGHGRFASLNAGHTLRIAREQSVLQKDVERIQKGTEKERHRWKHDGLNSLKYSVISEDIWDSPSEPSIEYHRARVRRGDASHWQLHELRILVISSLCPGQNLLWWRLGQAVPKNVPELRAIIARKPLPEGCLPNSGWADNAGLAALDLSWSHARPLDDSASDVLLIFFRQLVHPSIGAIIVHHGGMQDLRSSFSKYGRTVTTPEHPAFAKPVTTLICWGHADGSATNVQIAPCLRQSDDWHFEGAFIALREQRPGFKAYCLGRQTERGEGGSRLAEGDNCGGSALGSRWQHVATFFLPSSAIRIPNSVMPPEQHSEVCVRHDSGHAELLVGGSQCRGLRLQHMGLSYWITVWAADGGALLLERSPANCHLFICSKFFLGHYGGRFVDNRESGN
jgi:hypothetical protein